MLASERSFVLSLHGVCFALPVLCSESSSSRVHFPFSCLAADRHWSDFPSLSFDLLSPCCLSVALPSAHLRRCPLQERNRLVLQTLPTLPPDVHALFFDSSASVDIICRRS